jgi:hypothetical protein
MKALKITVFLLAVLVLTTQFARHIYVRYLEARGSVLDRYEQTETRKAIKGAASLDELVSRYDAAKNALMNSTSRERRPRRTGRRTTGTCSATNSGKSTGKTTSRRPT